VDEIVLMGDARVAAVPVEPLDDPLVDLRGDFATSGLKDDDDNPRFSWVRAGLAERLLAARAHLPDGYSLQVVEGLRPAVLQDRYFTWYRDGAPCDLGTAVNATPEASRGACYFDAPDLGRAARHHRAVLAGALLEVGLVNYPSEWWHWSYGDRYWALTTGRPAAVYGPVS
jgi:D-alanyl-D-alanine dipeptidase